MQRTPRSAVRIGIATHFKKLLSTRWNVPRRQRARGTRLLETREPHKVGVAAHNNHDLAAGAPYSFCSPRGQIPQPSVSTLPATSSTSPINSSRSPTEISASSVLGPSAAMMAPTSVGPWPHLPTGRLRSGSRTVGLASQTRRSSHHHVSQAPGQRVDLACVRVDRAHRVHGHCAFDAPVGIGYCAHSALTPVITRPLARHEICSDRTIPTTPIAASGTGGLLPSPRSSKSPLMERHARLSTGCPPGPIAFV